jgi:tetratricopeptide (TPR) repeat protein
VPHAILVDWLSGQATRFDAVDKMELSRLIRFGLNDLSARNGHHGFEELCRALAAQRIASNIQPATGPVSGGGDQGRDFQTFVSHIAAELGPHGGFAALVSKGPIAFLCTLQADGLPSKIRSDLKKIAVGGPAVDTAYAMLAADLPAASAAKLKREAKAEYGIALEILDGQALAELLSDHDTFWIAARWLAIPAEFAPEPPSDQEEPDWYRQSRKRWREEESPPLTIGDVLDLRASMRRAVNQASARSDLGFWLALLRQAGGPGRPDHVRQRARYELAFGTLRGLGDLRPADEEVEAFLATLDPSSATWAELLDAGILTQYVSSAVVRGLTNLGADWVTDQNGRLREAIESRLEADDLSLTERTGLLDVLGNLRAYLDPNGFELPSEPMEPIDILSEDRSDPPGLRADVPLFDPEGAIAAWLEFARLAPEAPMVPVDSLTRVVGLLAPALVDHAGFNELTEMLDAIRAASAGDSAAAESCRDRALSLLRAGRPLKALQDLHEAKVRWWHGDTIRGSLLALLLLAKCYRDLGLPMAARQQALIATSLAHVHGDDEHGDLLTAGLMVAADLDYSTGAWCAATESYGVATLSHAVHAEDPWNPERHSDVTAAHLHGGYIRAAAKMFDEALAGRIIASQDEVGLGEVIEEAEELVPSWSEEEWREQFTSQMQAVPFADAGEMRRIRWSALGIDWEVSAVNTYEHCRAAERFAAAAQILCAELAGEDLVLLSTTIRVRVQATDPERTRSRSRTRSESGNEGSDWIVDLIPMGRDGSDLDAEEVSMELTSALVQVLFEASLVSWKQHIEVLERCFQRGLSHKLIAGRPYDDVAGVVPRAIFEGMRRQSITVPVPWRELPPSVSAPALDATSKPGPGYSRESSEELIANRYRRMRELLCETLPRLAEDRRFQETYQLLLAEGWKDWHVLLALFNARVNERNERGGRTLGEAKARFAGGTPLQPETPGEPDLPANWLTPESLREVRRFAFLSGLENWDLELHQPTPDLGAVEELLGRRYGYLTDDIEHDRLFKAMAGQDSNLRPSGL